MHRMNSLAIAALSAAALLATSCGGSKGPDPAASPSGAAIRTISPTGKTGSMKRLPGIPVFNVDHINSTTNPFARAETEIKVSQSDPLVVSGWAIDAAAKSAAAGVELVVDGAPFAAQYGVKRDEIAKYFKNPACLASGFKLEVPVSELATPGAHRVNLRVILKDESGYQESPVLSLVVAQ